VSFKVVRQIGDDEAVIGERETFAEAQHLLFRYVAEGGAFEYLGIDQSPYDPNESFGWLFRPNDPAHQAAVERVRKDVLSGHEPHRGLP
jgi:hypothetical protein